MGNTDSIVEVGYHVLQVSRILATGLEIAFETLQWLNKFLILYKDY